jgi:ABC-type transporter Mla subunit MlaD
MKDDHVAILLEDINGKLDGLADVIKGVSEKVDSIDQRLEHVETNTEHLPAVEAAVTDQSHQLNELEQRITSLEQAA